MTLLQPSKQMDQSCRTVLDALERDGELLHVLTEVDPVHDIAAVLSLTDGKAVRFARPKGSEIGVFAGILSSRERIARVLNTAVDQIEDHLLAAIRRPIPPQIVENAPVQAVVETQDVLTSLPIPTFFEKETGPYITAGLIVANDPETGLGNASYARIKVLGPKEAMIGIAPNHHLAIMARKAEAAGHPLPFAVILGAHPIIQLASCLYLGLGDDEMHCAGALMGEPVRMVSAMSIDVLVPAEAEIVLEGHIYANESIVEGLVSEYHGMYEDYGSGMRCSFTCQTRRKDAMLQVIQPGYHQEHLFLGAVPIAASLKAVLSKVILNVGRVAVTMSGSGRTNVVIQIDKPRPGQARRAMMACWGAVSIVKNITVVDSDVDPWDLEAVELARLTRMRAERDVLIIAGLPADRSEPQEEGGTITKIGYDATCKAGDRKEGFDKALPPEAAMDRARALLARHHPEVKL